MFDKKNQENISNINEEFEAIKESILSIIDSVSINGKEINPHLDAIDRRLDKLDCYLDSVSTRWVSKNSGLEEMRGYIRKLNILFNGLVKDMYDKVSTALGENFDPIEYHQKILDLGPAPMRFVEQRVLASYGLE